MNEWKRNKKWERNKREVRERMCRKEKWKDIRTKDRHEKQNRIILLQFERIVILDK